MYIAIILENFNQAHQEEEIGIVEDDLEMFYIRWSKYDPHATQFIHFSQLSDFIASLDPPLGIAKPNTVALVSFNLAISKGNKIHCLDILHALVKHVLGHVEETDNFKQLQVISICFLNYFSNFIFLFKIKKNNSRNKWISNLRNNSQRGKNWKLCLQHEFGKGKIKQRKQYNLHGGNI